MSLFILIKDNLFNKTQREISFYILYLLQKKLNYEISPFTIFLIDFKNYQNEKGNINSSSKFYDHMRYVLVLIRICLII